MNKSSHSNIYKKDDPKKDWRLRVAAGINVFPIGLGIGCNFIIDNQLQPTERLAIIISSSHSFSNWVQA